MRQCAVALPVAPMSREATDGKSPNRAGGRRQVDSYDRTSQDLDEAVIELDFQRLES
jgi:hypothetical protein